MSHSSLKEGSERQGDSALKRKQFDEMFLGGRSFSGRERHCVYLNTGSERFANISAVSGLDFPDDGRAVAPVDWDQDGDLDLWISNRNAPRIRLLKNNTSRDRHYLALRLQGDGSKTNRDAIGARVELVVGDDELKRITTLRCRRGVFSAGKQVDPLWAGRSTAS